jgi:hypothetical protein
VTTHRRGGRHRVLSISLAVVLLLIVPAGCGGDDDDGENGGEPVDGTFVGKLAEADTLVAVVAAPAKEGQEEREITVYACDGSSLCESFSGSASGNEFEVSSDDDAAATGELSDDEATGTIELPDGEVEYTATPAAATSGVYKLTVSATGGLRGVSATGVAVRGESTAPKPGNGTLRLADGSQPRFEVVRSSSDDVLSLSPGQVRLIVLAGGDLAGFGVSPGKGDGSGFFIGSSSK